MEINNKDIIQSYIMTTSKYDYNVHEKRILTRLVETWQHVLEGNKLDSKIAMNKTLFGNFEMELPISYFVPDGNTNFEPVKDALRNLNKKSFEYSDKQGNWSVIRVIEMPHIQRGEKVRFTINWEVAECFLDFSKGYRKFELETLFSFKSIYTMRFYELVSGQTGVMKFKIETLKEMFKVGGKYTRPNDFIKRVIDPAKKELDEKGSYSFEYNTIKLGHKFHRIDIYPIKIDANRDKNLETKALQKQVNISWDFDKMEREYLGKLGFSETQIKNNMGLLLNAKKHLDFILELSVLVGKISEKTRPQGFVIEALRGKLKDRGIIIERAKKKVSTPVK